MNKIEELRKNLGLSLDELAEKLSIDPRLLYQYETGVSEPSSDILMNLADFFGVSTCCVSGLPEPGFPASPYLQYVTRVTEATDCNDVNLLLREGWHLLHIGNDVQKHEDGTSLAQIVYTLGWYGKPDDARPHLPPNREISRQILL